jgi:hypothetical protein
VRVQSREVFDNVISGAGPWYTSESLASDLGQCDVIALHAVPTAVSSPAPTLTIQPEYSADGQNWYNPGTTFINWSIVSGSSVVAGVSNWPMSRVRFKVTMSGTSPKCRLKLYFTGRSAAAKNGVSA